jgi:unsaturated rhamnogalacturonyl hydrolase
MTWRRAQKRRSRLLLVACLVGCERSGKGTTQDHGADGCPSGPATEPSALEPGMITLQPGEVAQTLRRVADWPLQNAFPNDPRHWSMAALYDGLIEASLTTGDPKYLAAVLRAGRRVNFILGSRTYHADGHGAGHAWLTLYEMDPELERDFLEPFIEQFNEIVENPIVEPLTFLEAPPAGLRRTDRWSWADALYMSPPTIAMLAKATGDKRYTRFMDAEVRVTYDALYDTEAHLWYRDETYIDRRTPNGKKVFWGRGNGWAYAGFSHMLEDVPPDYPTRCFYDNVLVQMSGALLAAQQPEGHWYTSLADPAQVPVGETSSSALFVYGIARGVRAGLLDAATYWPAVERGWRAINTRIDPDGAVNFVQPFGEAPEVFPLHERVPYGTGAVLLAAAEISRSLGISAKLKPRQLLEEARELAPTAPDLSSVCDDCEPQ